jgi:hypothetical protein
METERDGKIRGPTAYGYGMVWHKVEGACAAMVAACMLEPPVVTTSALDTMCTSLSANADVEAELNSQLCVLWLPSRASLRSF